MTLILFVSCSQLVKSPIVKRKLASSNEFKCAGILEDFLALEKVLKQSELETRQDQLREKFFIFRRMFHNYVANKEGELFEILRMNKEIMYEVYEILELVDVKSVVKTREYRNSNINFVYEYIEFEDFFESKRVSMKSIKRHMKLAEIEIIELDLLENFFEGTGGGYFSLQKRLTMTDSALIRLLKTDSLGDIIKHEISHAYRVSSEQADPKSIYHILYFTKNGKRMPNSLTGYEHVLKLDELYTYANNIFWDLDEKMISELLKLQKNKTGYFKKYIRNLENLSQIAIQAMNMSKISHKTFEELSYLNEPLYGGWLQIKYNKYIMILLGPGIYTRRLLQPEDKSYVTAIEKITEFMNENNIPSFIESMNWSLGMVPEVHMVEFMNLYKNLLFEEKKILRREMKRDELASVKAKNLVDTGKLLKKINEVIESYQRYRRQEIDASQMREVLSDLKRVARNLGLIVRQNTRPE